MPLVSRKKIVNCLCASCSCCIAFCSHGLKGGQVFVFLGTLIGGRIRYCIICLYCLLARSSQAYLIPRDRVMEAIQLFTTPPSFYYQIWAYIAKNIGLLVLQTHPKYQVSTQFCIELVLEDRKY